MVPGGEPGLRVGCRGWAERFRVDGNSVPQEGVPESMGERNGEVRRAEEIWVREQYREVEGFTGGMVAKKGGKGEL